LVPLGLVCLVEERPHLRELAKHDLVEVGGKRFAAGFKQGYGRFHNGALGVGKHRNSFGVIG
jgi:hypothetical protein